MLEQYVEEKIACRLREQVAQVYLVLRGKLADWSRDFVRVRQTLERLRNSLESEGKISADSHHGWTTQMMFPGGSFNWPKRAIIFTHRLSLLPPKIWMDGFKTR